MATSSQRALTALRLAAQGIARPSFEAPVDVVRHVLAMQAQDFPRAKWSVGLRPTFPLLDEWVKNPRRLEGDEAIAEFARRYFTSHGAAVHQPDQEGGGRLRPEHETLRRVHKPVELRT